MLLLWKLLILLSFKDCLAERHALHGPVFTQEPSDITFPLDSENRKVFINCKAQGNPLPEYRWKINGRDIDLGMDYHYSLVEGNLLINNPDKNRHGGTYQCFATNSFGTIVSREANVQFAYLENFNSKLRNAVPVREGQAVVLLCGPPPHSGELTYSWIFNEHPNFVQQDSRRFVSQKTGNLYIAKVEASDVGNYTCVVRNVVTNTIALSSPTPVVLRRDAVMGEYEPKIEVQFSDIVSVAKGSSVKLECFALGNPVPVITWRRADGAPFTGKVKMNSSNGILEIPYFQQEDAGAYECTAENSRGKNTARGRLTFYDFEHLQWVQTLKDSYMAIEDTLFWECKASGKPNPMYRWLKNGDPLVLEDRIQVENSWLTITRLNLTDSGMYQCLAENNHGTIYASAELKVIASPPDFSRSPVKKTTLIPAGGEVIIECRPKASPRATFSWKKGSEVLKENKRITFLEDGSLRIGNITKLDGGRYTCVARNAFGKSSSTGSLVVKDPTKIILPPLSIDATVGESIVLPCEVSKDSTLDVTFKWFFNGKLIDFNRQGDHYEKIGGSSAGDLMIRNIQLNNAGKYVCMVHTVVDTVSAAADLIVRGPPGPPENLRVLEVADTTAQLSWRPGSDNGSPITTYTIQARTPFSIGWQAVKTVPEVIPGNMLRTTVVDLNPWVDYECRVVASNSVGVGEPSAPSNQFKTKTAVPEVAPANVSGGGGCRSELVITWEPIPEEFQNGEGFGYVVAFRPAGTSTWMQTVVASAEATRYVFKNESIPPLSLFEVRVGVYNIIGEGPFSQVTTVYSAEEEPSMAPTRVLAKSLSASEIEVYWDPVPWEMSSERILGYEVVYWDKDELQQQAEKVRSTEATANITGLKGSTLYFIEVKAYNSAGTGPSSAPVNITTKKPPPSQPPGKIQCNLTNSKIFLNWEHVKAMENESEVIGYKVIYRPNWHSRTNVVETNKTSVELQLPPGEDYFIEIKTLSDGGDGSSSGPIRIPKMSSLNSKGLSAFISNVGTMTAFSTVVFSLSSRLVLL